MNEVITQTTPTPEGTVEVRHFVLAIDPETGEEIKIEVFPTGEVSQEKEDEDVPPTIH